MAQFARPDSDVSTGSWTTAPLWQKIDEATASDADFISDAGILTTDTAECGLSNVTDPESSSGHVIRYRARRGSVGTHTLNVRLMQGTTVIASTTQTLTTSFALYTYTLTAAEADAITDYTNLRLQFRYTGTQDASFVDVSWAEFEVPSAVISRTLSDSVSASDAPRRILQAVRATTPKLSLTENASRFFTFDRLFAESQNLTVAAIRLTDYLRYASEAAAVTDSILRSPLDLTRRLSESEAMTDELARFLSYDRTFSESQSISVAAARLAVYARDLLEALSVVDSIFRGPFSPIRHFSETIILSDALSRTLLASRLRAETIAVADDVFRVPISFERHFSDSLSMADNVARFLLSVRITAAVLSLSEASFVERLLDRLFSESQGVSVAHVVLSTLLRNLSESVPLVDALLRVYIGSKSASVGLSLSEFALRAVESDRLSSESVNVSVSASAGLELLRLLADGIPMTDALLRVYLASRDMAPNLTLSEVLARSSEIYRLSTEPLPVSVTSRRDGLYFRRQSDSVSTLDSLLFEFLVATVDQGSILKIFPEGTNDAVMLLAVGNSPSRDSKTNVIRIPAGFDVVQSAGSDRRRYVLTGYALTDEDGAEAISVALRRYAEDLTRDTQVMFYLYRVLQETLLGRIESHSQRLIGHGIYEFEVQFLSVG